MTIRELSTIGCAVAAGVMAGFFYAFSMCVMKALGKLPPPQGIAAMQSINVIVLNPVFLTLFSGTALASAVASAAALVQGRPPGTTFIVAASVLYVVGCFGVTMVCNVPRNNALMALGATTPEAARYWADYLVRWTAWNHVRMFAALAAALLFTLALRARG